MAPGNGEAEEPSEPEGPTHAEIAELAYLYWKERGSRQGYDLDDWLDAEEDLLNEQEGEQR